MHAIIKKEEARRQKLNQQELSSKAYQLFSESKTPIEDGHHTKPSCIKGI
jgi:hypothetical protein